MLLAEVLSFSSLDEARKEIEKIDVNPVGVKIMALKSVFKVISAKNILIS